MGISCGVQIGEVRGQQTTILTQEQKDQRWEMEKELESIAIIDRKVMMTMRDGIRLATDIYRPKNASGRVPIIWVRTPYNFNFWDVRNGVPADMKAALTAVKHGYAYVVQNERGHFFSEGDYDILGAPRTDGYDALEWMSSQPWANGKVGTTGCSSTAEYQMGVAAMGHPADAAMNVRGSAPEWDASRRTTNKVIFIVAALFRCCLSPGSTGNRTRCGQCSRATRHRKI
jgi:uncharacterized protein